MSNVTIGARLQVDSGNTAQSVKQVRDNIKQLKTELDQCTVGSEQHTATLQKLKAANDQLNPSLAAQKGGLAGVTQGLKDSVPGFGGAMEGAKGLGAAFKALLANPIVLLIAAIVAGLKLLYDSFKNSFEGGQKLEQVFAGISAVGKVLLENITKIGSAIIKALSFDFSGAIAEIKGVADAAADAYSKMANLKKEEQKLARELADDELADAERARRIAELREQVNDDTIPIAKRRKLAQDLKKETEQNAKDDMDLAKRVADNKIAQLSITENEAKKNYAEIKKIQTEQVNNATQNINEMRLVDKQVANLDRQAKQEAQEREKEHQAKIKEAKEKAQEEERRRKENERAYNDKLLKLQHENELQQIKDANQKKLRELDFSIQDQRKLVEDDFTNKRISATQKAELLAEIERSYQLKVAELAEERRKAEEAKRLAEDKAEADRQAKNQAMDMQRLDYQIKQAGDDLTLQQSLLDQKQAAIEAQFQREFMAAGRNLELRRELELKHTQDLDGITQQRIAIAESERKARTEGAQHIGAAMGALADLIGKQTAAGKALAIAQATINTWLGVTEVLRAKSVLPEPVATISKIANAAAIVASGIGAIRNIVKTNVPGGGGGGSVPSSLTASTPAPLSPSATTTQLDANSLNQIGNAASRAFVVESDISKNSERITRLNRAARLA